MVWNNKPLEQRFWEKVTKGAPDECWPFTGTKNNKGYGMLQKRVNGLSGKRLAHRISYEMNIGPIPDGACVLHRCDNPPCVNPKHLFLGSMKDNTADMIAKGRKVIGFNPNNRPPIKRGSEHRQAKLTEALVAQYRDELSGGKSLRQLARETGLDRKTLMAMRDRKSWRHVP